MKSLFLPFRFVVPYTLSWCDTLSNHSLFYLLFTHAHFSSTLFTSTLLSTLPFHLLFSSTKSSTQQQQQHQQPQQQLKIDTAKATRDQTFLPSPTSSGSPTQLTGSKRRMTDSEESDEMKDQRSLARRRLSVSFLLDY